MFFLKCMFFLSRPNLVFFSIETYLAGEIAIQIFFDRVNLKIFLLPGLEAQKVENHCTRVLNWPMDIVSRIEIKRAK